MDGYAMHVRRINMREHGVMFLFSFFPSRRIMEDLCCVSVRGRGGREGKMDDGET